MDGVVFIVAVGALVFFWVWVACDEHARDARKYAAFKERVDIRNPDRVARLYGSLSEAGRDSIRNRTDFLEDEQRLYAVGSSTSE